MCAISGPSGAINLGFGSGNAEGGITITPVEDINTMVTGADGAVQHNLHSAKPATVTVRLLKTSPENAALMDMYNLDTNNAGSHGRNVISLRTLAGGDVITCEETAFARAPDLTYAKEGGENVWTFHSGRTNRVLGRGLAVAA
jgi:hypothetical protein